jgi:phosphatidylglycerol:prolipoprotein diacylglycerol transferase
MFPILIEIGPLTLHTYGLLVATGFLLGIGWAARLGGRDGMDPQRIYDAGFWIVVAAVIGSRLIYVGVNYDYYLAHPLGVFKLWEGGLVFYGGLLGAIVATLFCVRRYKLDLWRFADVAAPGLALGHVFGRFGCFAAGCCYGAPTDALWGVAFPDVQNIAPVGVALHPTQLYDAFNESAIFLILTLRRPYRRFAGEIFLLWVMLYAAGRTTVEFFRGDPRGLWFDGAISTSQIFAVIGFALAFGAYLWMRKRSSPSAA